MKHKLIAVLMALMVVAVQSEAAILSSATRDQPTFVTDGLTHVVPLNDAGDTSITFKTSAPNKRVVISYSAECAVGGNDQLTFLDLDILVDGVAAPPSDSDNAFCSGEGTVPRAHWASVVTVVVAQVPNAGTHTVQVRATLQKFNTGDSWSLDDSTIVVTN
jgi:hypothetical protein